MSPNIDYLDKLKKITDNNNSVTFIVTVIILFTFFVFILILYNFLSKSSANCNNIDKAYKEIYKIEGTNVKEEDKVLIKSENKRVIDISFGMSLTVKKNIELLNAVQLTTSIRLDSVDTAGFDIDLIKYNNITSKNMTKSLEDLSTLKFVNDDHTLKTDTFKELFDIDIITIIDNKNYYKFDCDKSLYDNTNAASTPGDNQINKIGTNYKVGYDSWYVYNTSDLKPTDYIDTTQPNINKILINNTTKNIIYIPEDYIKIRQNTFKYTYSSKPGNLNNVVSTRDIELLNNRGNIEKVLNKIHNNYILTAFNCCNSGEYQNNYVDTCILKKCLNLGIRCLDFQIFNYNQKPIIASSTMDSLYIKETFNYLELEPVLDIITNYLNNDDLGSNNTSPLFLHFRVMSLSEKIYKELNKSILEKLGKNQEGKNFELVIGIDNINTISLNELKNKIVVFINPYYTSNNSLINQLDTYINDVKSDLNIVKDYKIYKSGNIINSNSDLILYKNNNYDIYKDSHNKSKPTLVLPEFNSKINDESFIKYMDHNITFIAMKFQEVDNFLQVAIHIFSKYENESGFLLKNSIDSSTFEINLQPDGRQILRNNVHVESY
tara:strand:- start:2325 stop:4139 length:1815 start_codon:yes stop_codon:yes gene_type:complete